jgi:DnaJ-class molecular chaperone
MTITLPAGETMTLADARRLRDALDKAIRAAEQPTCGACRGTGRSAVCSLVCPRCGGSGREPFL